MSPRTVLSIVALAAAAILALATPVSAGMSY
jgi:hypothetical protein